MNLADAELFSTQCPSGGGSGSCKPCRAMCASGYPGRFTPDEAMRAMDVGLASRLICLRYRKTTVLRPAIIGWEGLAVAESELVRGQCVFLTVGGGCELHRNGPKPLECRTASCRSMDHATQRRADDVYRQVVAAIECAWRSRAGQAAVKRWREEIARLTEVA